MTQGSLLAWLHLSDIHIGHGAADHQADQNLVLEALRADVARQIAAGIPKPDVVLVTGDIAFSGACRNKHEYKRAAAWLKKIAGAVELGPEAVFVVPGNHDVQRPVDKPDKEDLLRALRNGKKTVDNVLPDRAIRKYLAARQANYFAFVKGFASACSATEDSKLPPGCWQHSLPRRDRLTVRLCGLNTALLAADEKVYGADGSCALRGEGPLVGPAAMATKGMPCCFRSTTSSTRLPATGCCSRCCTLRVCAAPRGTLFRLIRLHTTAIASPSWTTAAGPAARSSTCSQAPRCKARGILRRGS